jgi:hypothetical protein
MSSGTRRFVQGACRAVVDLVSLMTLFPVLAVSYTGYRIAVIIMLYALKDISVEQLGAVVDQVNVIVAEIREEGLEGLKSRLYAVAQTVAKATVDMAKSIYSWASNKMSEIVADFRSQAPTAPIYMLTS